VNEAAEREPDRFGDDDGTARLDDDARVIVLARYGFAATAGTAAAASRTATTLTRTATGRRTWLPPLLSR